jgi:hypothetical protein
LLLLFTVVFLLTIVMFDSFCEFIAHDFAYL